MKNKNIVVGSIVQIAPKKSVYDGMLLVVTEILSEGVQGYIFMDRIIPDLVRTKGRAYLRLKFEEVEYVGMITWIVNDE